MGNKVLEVLRLINTDKKSNVGAILILQCSNLIEVCLEGFLEMKSLKIENCPNLENLFMRNMRDISKLHIDQESCRALRRFEFFFFCKTPIKSLLESSQNLLNFKFEAAPKLLRAFTVFINFPSSTHPNKAGVNWNLTTHPTPQYFSNSGPCHKDSSRDLISRRLFPFFRRVVADHLYSCGYGLDMERHTGEVFSSCRGT